MPAVDLSLPFAPSWTWYLGGQTVTLAGRAEDLDITPSDDDPNKLYKIMDFASFKKTRQAVPRLLDFIKGIIEKNSMDASESGRKAGYRGFHFIVSVPVFLSLPPDPDLSEKILSPFCWVGCAGIR